MQHELTKIEPWQTAKITAVMAFAFTAVFLLLIFVVMLLNPAKSPFDDGESSGAALGLFSVLPIFYAVATYFITVVMCYMYNLLASRFGGIRYHTLAKNIDHV